ncbi:OmpA family protein [uncultured Prevotella sp.]|uniref:PorE family type IX secretion system protein n=1 Tax=uncultured Prevotella sp. TaxID=159272 RepID=UPI00262657E4|nr:OmpA family protein [uncultured Prevotella sp.]
MGTALVSVLILMLVSCGAERSFKKGEKFLALGEYFDAAAQYKKAYSNTKPKDKALRGKYAAKMALCYNRINFNQKAVAAYRNAIRYHADSIDMHLAFAKALLKDGNYKEAEQEFRMLLDSMPGNVLARNGLQSALTARKLKEEGSQYIVKKMDLFNSRRADFSPMFCGDQYEQLFFTSTRNEAEGDELSGITGTKNGDIFYSQKDEKGKWGKPQQITSGLNTEFDEGACCFSPDQRVMYLTQCVSDPSYPRYATIVTSNRSDAAWSKVSKLEVTRDTLSSYAHPAVSPDGEWLYFASDMPGGKGGFDIWRVRLTAAGLGGVENLGEPINTPGDEMFPTFRPNGDLYFSSNGHPGLGGLDIFIARYDKNSRKVVLEHPGYPLNSQADDFGMTFEGAHNKGFFSSNRGDGRGWDHIYSFEKPEIIQTVTGWVYEMEGYELPSAQVYIVGNDGTNKTLSVKGDGSFTEVVTPGVDYVLLATCKGFLNHKEEISIKPSAESQDHVLQFPLASIRVPVLIDNIFYDFDKYTLRAESTAALDELVKLLEENPNVTIELSSHCDYKGSEAYNKTLSQRRAETVVKYLISKGIKADRLTPVGYGKMKPKTIRKKLTEKYTWLKEGDVLTEDYIKKLDKEKQEICNQLNRRTEFIVLRTTYGMFDEKGNLKNPPKPKTEKENAEEDSDNIFMVE